MQFSLTYFFRDFSNAWLPREVMRFSGVLRYALFIVLQRCCLELGLLYFGGDDDDDGGGRRRLPGQAAQPARILSAALPTALFGDDGGDLFFSSFVLFCVFPSSPLLLLFTMLLLLSSFFFSSSCFISVKLLFKSFSISFNSLPSSSISFDAIVFLTSYLYVNIYV